MKKRAILLLVATVALAGGPFARSVPGDIFVLRTGGEIRGELVSEKGSPPKQYVIHPYAGGQLALDASLVTRVVSQEPLEVAYEKFALHRKDTVKDHWIVAEWCRERRLTRQRETHLRRILELDGDHDEARRALGYELADGRWLTRDELMKQRGRVKHNGRWMLPQAVKLLQQRETQKNLEQGWFTKVRLWHGWLDGSKAARGRDYLLAITDPHAVPALIKAVEAAKDYSYKEIFAEALANVGSPAAVEALASYSIEDDDEEFRYFCLELLEKTKPPAAVGIYVRSLGSKDNRHVNRAALGLGMMGDKSVVGPLIDVLITDHKFRLGSGNPGQMTTTFGRSSAGGGTSFGTGGGPKIVKKMVRNEEVLAALSRLTGKDFDFDVAAWKRWFATQRPAVPAVNTRRDDG
jgi:hypothetical protein